MVHPYKREAIGMPRSNESMAAQRRRFGLSAAECSLLIGASSQSIYNWEEGKARPRAQHLPRDLCAQEPRSSASERDPGDPQSRLVDCRLREQDPHRRIIAQAARDMSISCGLLAFLVKGEPTHLGMASAM
jgi:DNA-binding XRE family transcriptional regulator